VSGHGDEYAIGRVEPQKRVKIPRVEGVNELVNQRGGVMNVIHDSYRLARGWLSHPVDADRRWVCD
jgi:hypothetical protein